jgi:hypothetical protein
VDVSVFSTASQGNWVGGICQVEEDETSGERAIARLESSGTTVVSLFVGDDIVGSAQWELLVPPAVKVILVAEDLGTRGIDVQKFPQVKDLDTVVDGLTSDDKIALVTLDLAPQRWLSGCVLRQSSKVDELTLLRHLGKRCAVFLGNADELPTLRAGPAPGPGTTTVGASKLCVRLEVVEIKVLALEGVLGISRDIGCVAVVTCYVVRILVEGGVLSRVKYTLRIKVGPDFLYGYN